jgi:ATP-dependent Clp protease protease subunit
VIKGENKFMEFLLPQILENAESEKYLTPELYTYWKARENRTFYIDYEIDEMYSLIELGKIIIQMNMEEKDTPKSELKPIFIWIHSYGGDLEQCHALIDIIEVSRIPIVTIAMGVAMSAGFMLFLAGHKRYAFRHSNLMVHEGSAAFSGTAEQIEQAQKNYKKQIDGMKEYILSRTEIPEKVFNKNKTKDWYLSAKELIEYKVVDKLVENFDEILN